MQRHPFDAISAMFGFLFVTVGVGVLSELAEFSDLADWVVPGLVGILGASFIARALGSNRGDAETVESASALPSVLAVDQRSPLVEAADERWRPMTDTEAAVEEVRREIHSGRSPAPEADVDGSAVDETQ